MWSVPPIAGGVPGQGGEQATLRNKKLASGIEVIAGGVVPWYLDRADGWRCTAHTAPNAAELPTYLLEAGCGRTAPSPRQRNVGLDHVLRAALRGDLRQIVTMPTRPPQDG